MLIMDLGWQGVVSSMWVMPWDDRVEGGRVLKDLRCGEMDFWVHWGGRVIFRDSSFFRFSLVLRYG